MATMTKSETLTRLAEKTGLSKKDVANFLDELAMLAHKEARNGFKVPGLGKLVLRDRKARVGRNPATGAQIQIPAKRVLKFVIAKEAKDAVLPAKKPAVK